MQKKVLAHTFHFYPGILCRLKNGTSARSEIVVATMLHVHKIAQAGPEYLHTLSAQCTGDECDIGPLRRSPLIRADGQISEEVLNILRSAIQEDTEGFSITISSPLSLDVYSDKFLADLILTSKFTIEEATLILKEL